MKLFRFMSFNEFRKYHNNEILINVTDHNKEKNKKTNSIGFCFFNYAHYEPEEIFHSVTGIVDGSICCIFETNRENVIKTWGRYARTVDKERMLRESFITEEYCTTTYSKSNFKLLKYAIPDWFNWNKWNWREI